MANKEFFCKRCGKKTEFSHITDRLYICSVYGCGMEKEIDNGGKGKKTMAKLTEEQKAEIRTRKAAGESNKVLAAEFGCTENTVWYTCKKAGEKKTGGKGCKNSKKIAWGESDKIIIPAAKEYEKSFKAEMERIIDERVTVKLGEEGGEGREILRRQIAEILTELLK